MVLTHVSSLLLHAVRQSGKNCLPHPLVQEHTDTTDTVCQPVTQCATNEFELKPPTLGSNRQCQHLTICSSDEYQTKGPSATSDRECASITQCAKIHSAEACLAPKSDKEYCQDLCSAALIDGTKGCLNSGCSEDGHISCMQACIIRRAGLTPEKCTNYCKTCSDCEISSSEGCFFACQNTKMPTCSGGLLKGTSSSFLTLWTSVGVSYLEAKTG
eukprot:m.185037 g.185037  ORF g.185037 m.185037 type:complete len:215 (+) comp15565_c0_seq6:612-1256(+)